MLTPWLQCRQRGACQPESVLWVSQPYLSQKYDLGEGATVAVQTEICANFPLPKTVIADGQMLDLLDWWVWFTGARRNKGSGRKDKTSLLCQGVEGCSAAEQLTSVGSWFPALSSRQDTSPLSHVGCSGTTSASS